MKSKSKIASSFEIIGIPARYFFGACFLLFLSAYFLLGHSDNSGLMPKTGLVKEFKQYVYKHRGRYIYYITLHGTSDTLYFQNNYIDEGARYILHIDKNKLATLNSMIQPNDTVSFFYDPKQEVEILESRRIAQKTYGLIVNGNTMIDASHRKYFTFGIGLLGTFACLSLLVTLFIFVRDISETVREKREKKLLTKENNNKNEGKHRHGMQLNPRSKKDEMSLTKKLWLTCVAHLGLIIFYIVAHFVPSILSFVQHTSVGTVGDRGMPLVLWLICTPTLVVAFMWKSYLKGNFLKKILYGLWLIFNLGVTVLCFFVIGDYFKG